MAAFRSIVLAGERPGGSPLSRELSVPASVLVPVGGRASVVRVVEALRACRWVDGGILCGPERSVVENSEVLERLLSTGDFRWLPPQPGPAASALAALAELDRPVLLTTGDHALLSASILDEFCPRALESPYDAVVGLVSYPRVRSAFPGSRRTVLRFADGAFCGSNLFAILSRRGERAPQFWRRLESDRKWPWKMARKLGWGTLLRYLAGRLALDDAVGVLSERAQCAIGYILLDDARAAVDVDSVSDWRLANHILGAARSSEGYDDIDQRAQTRNRPPSGQAPSACCR